MMDDLEEETGPTNSTDVDPGVNNSSLDLLEQQQAIEQARLLNRFRELRTWQQKQQEQLMLQQQVQLDLLRDDQSRVQNMLKVQRQQQWGAGTIKTGTHPIRSPSKVSAKYNGNGESDLINTRIPEQNGIVGDNAQASLPKPIIYEESTEMEGDNYTNPELFSNPGSMDQLEDGMFNAYDTGSEFSNPSSAQQLTLQNLLRSTSPETLKAMLALIPRARLIGSDNDLSPHITARDINHGVSPRSKKREANLAMSPRSKLREITISPRARLNKSPSPRSSGSVITELERREQFTNGKDQNGHRVNEMAPQIGETNTRFEDGNVPQNVKRHLFLDDDNDSVDSEIVTSKLNNQYKLDEKTTVKPSVETEEDLENGQMTETQNREDLMIDDRPIKPGLAGKKTFEQLLEEQLIEEEQKILAVEAEHVESPRDKKKPFLKRGQGLARFMGNKGTKEASVKQKKSEVKFKQPDKPANKDKHKHDPSTGPISNTAKSNQVSKPPGFKSKTYQSVPKTVSNQSTNPSVLMQTLKLNPNKNVSKPQSSSTAHQKPNSASNIQKSSNDTHNPSVPRTQPNMQNVLPSNVTGNPVETKELTPPTDPFDDDSSFAIGVRERIANVGKEQEELDEFELLEDFADNSSFCSNSSIVVKLLQADKSTKSGEPLVGLKTILEARKAQKQQNQHDKISENKTVVESKDDDTLVDENIDELSSDTLTDSDSSISSDSELNEEDIKFLTAKINLQQNRAFTKKFQSGAMTQNETKIDSAMDPIPSKSLTRKIASRDGFVLSSNVSTSSADVRSLLQRLTSTKGPHINQVLQNDGFRQFDTEYSRNKNSDLEKEKEISEDESEESTSEEGSDEETKDGENYVNDFDDEEAWTDNAPKSKNTGSSKSETASQSTPPTSRLVARLFPNVNQQPTDKQKKQQEAEKLQNTNQSDGIQSKILRDKLAELEIEIERFRNENSVLDKLRKEREEGLSKLKKEIGDFEKDKSEELNRLEEFKNQEMKKLKHERKMFEKYQKTIRSMPDKKDREEIDMLKNQLSELQEELKRKETRWMSSQTRLKDKLELVELENKELREEIKILEKKRIEWMQKEAASQKVQVNGHQSYPRSSTPTQETEEKHPNINSSHNSPPRNQPPSQKKGIVNQVKYQTASKSLSLTNDSIPTLLMSTGDPQPRTEPTKIARPSEKESCSSYNNNASSSSSLPRKLASKLLYDKPTIDKGNKQFEESQHMDGKMERVYKNGAREILFANGTRKEISCDGQSIVVSFFNGDIKQIFPDKRVVYYYADAQTSHTTYPDSLEVLQFQNGQIEKHYPDGTKEITFPDQTVKYLFPNGSEESIFPDGTVIRVDTNGDKTMEFPNGQREIHNSQFKRREYPDGTVKTVYPDGRQETRYSTGRLRLKDKDGNVIMDRIC